MTVKFGFAYSRNSDVYTAFISSWHVHSLKSFFQTPNTWIHENYCNFIDDVGEIIKSKQIQKITSLKRKKAQSNMIDQMKREFECKETFQTFKKILINGLCCQILTIITAPAETVYWQAYCSCAHWKRANTELLL